jgi:Tfp pilus assembly protein FimT
MIELALCLTIAGLLIAMGLPKMVGANSRRTVATAADQFVAAHSLARAVALRFGRESRLHIDTATGRFFVDVDTSGTGFRGRIGFPHDVGSSGVKIASTDTVLCFSARGLETAGGPCRVRVDTLKFTWPKDTATAGISLQINALGKVLR